MKEQPRAVLVEDNLMFAMMVEPALKRLGYTVRTLPGDPQIAGQIAAEQPDIVLVNLASDRQPGADVIRTLRTQPATETLPIIGYAGHVERHLLQAGREAGATLVVPNSAMRKALPEVLAKLERRLANSAEAEWPDED